MVSRIVATAENHGPRRTLKRSDCVTQAVIVIYDSWGELGYGADEGIFCEDIDVSPPDSPKYAANHMQILLIFASASSSELARLQTASSSAEGGVQVLPVLWQMQRISFSPHLNIY